MKDVKVLGLGCKRCVTTGEMVQAEADKLGVPVKVEKVSVLKWQATLRTSAHSLIRRILCEKLKPRFVGFTLDDLTRRQHYAGKDIFLNEIGTSR